MSKGTEPGRVLYRTEYFDLLGDINATLVMSQIHYWYMPNSLGQSKLRVFKDKKWWLAKTADEWWEETRLSKRQVERALQLLVAAGMIEVAVYRFNGSPTRHIVCDVLSRVSLKERLSFSPVGAFQIPSGCEPIHPQVQSLTETTSETTEEIKEADAQTPQPHIGVIKPHKEEQDMATAKELIASMKTKTGAQAGKVTPSALGMRWKKLLSAEGEYVKELTGKQLGQLKQLHTALGDQALTVLNYAVENWSAFCWEVRSAKALKDTPNKPDIGFLQMYHDVAVQLIAKKGTAPSVQPAPAAVQYAAPAEAPAKPTPPPAPVEDKPSTEDIMATLAALDALHQNT
jgi:hypothetical protein